MDGQTYLKNLLSAFLLLEAREWGYFYYLRNPYSIHSMSYNGRDMQLMLTENCHSAVVPRSFLLAKHDTNSPACKTDTTRALYVLEFRFSFDAIR